MNPTEDWKSHPRFVGVLLKTLITREMNPGLTMHLVRLAPGGAIPSHTHPSSTETFYVLSGCGICRIGAQEFALAPGVCSCVPPDVTHTVCNTGDSDLEAISVFNPPLV